MKIKVIANYLEESGLVCEKLDDQTTFWCEVNHITDNLRKMSAHDFMKLIMLSVDDSREEKHKFLSMFDILVGENKYSKKIRLIKLFCNLMALYDKFTPEDKKQIDLQFRKLNEHLYNLQPSSSGQPDVKPSVKLSVKPKRDLNLSAVRRDNIESKSISYYRLNLFVKPTTEPIKREEYSKILR